MAEEKETERVSPHPPKVSIVLRTLPDCDALHKYSPPSLYVRLHRVLHCSGELKLTPDAETPRVLLPSPPSYDPTSGGKFWISSSAVDGLFCIVYKLADAGPTDIIIWNPLTNRHSGVRWPGGVWNYAEDSISFVGFGYDAGIQDYKIVVVHGIDTHVRKVRCSVSVTSLKSGVWRRPEAEVPCLFLRPIREFDTDQDTNMDKLYCCRIEPLYFETVTVGECLYWVCITGSDGYSLLKFNLREEKLSLTIPLPMQDANQWCRYWSDWVKLSVFNGSLYICYLRLGRSYAGIHLWRRHTEDNSGSSRELWEKEERVAKFQNMHSVDSVGFTCEGVLMVISDDDLYAHPSPDKKNKPFYRRPLQYAPKGFMQTYHFLETGSSASP